jgi:RNA polymerase sigma factor (sigma-70 family)
MNLNTLVQEQGSEHLSSLLGDDALVLAAQAGNERAFAELWSRHSEMILRVLLRLTKNREDAEDALQETFLKAFAHLDSFESRAKFSTWLTRIAFNSGLMILRRQRSRPTISMDTQLEGGGWQQWDLEDRSLDVESSFMRAECAAVVNSALKRLGPTLAVVTRHQLMNHCSVAETAECHGLSVPATKSRLLRARSALRESLAWYK